MRWGSGLTFGMISDWAISRELNRTTSWRTRPTGRGGTRSNGTVRERSRRGGSRRNTESCSKMRIIQSMREPRSILQSERLRYSPDDPYGEHLLRLRRSAQSAEKCKKHSKLNQNTSFSPAKFHSLEGDFYLRDSSGFRPIRRPEWAWCVRRQWRRCFYRSGLAAATSVRCSSSRPRRAP